jgi:hypothetical protein
LIELRDTICRIKKTIYKDYSRLAKKYVEAVKELDELKKCIKEKT